MDPVVEVVAQLRAVAVISLGGWLALQRQLRIEDLVAFLMYAGYFYRPILALGQINDTVQQTLAGASRIWEVLDTDADVQAAPQAKTPARLGNRVEFRDVRFSYREGVEVLMACASAAARKDDASSAAAVRARAPREPDPSLLRRGRRRGGNRRRGRARPGPHLPAPTHRHGAAGRASCSPARWLEHRLRQAGRDPRGDRPRRADGERARVHRRARRRLRYGDRRARRQALRREKQRLSIARAILKDAPILILDEATSSVDTETEVLIQEALEHLTAGRTTIAIATASPQSSTPDQIVVLDEGRVAEEGTHAELLQQGGLSAELYEIQFRHQERASLAQMAATT